MTARNHDTDDVAFFVDLERRVWDALVDGDAAADSACLADDFLGVYPSGFGDRDEHAAQLASGPTVTDYEIVEPRLLRVADGHVMLAYRAVYRRSHHVPGTMRAPEEMYVSSLWSRIDGEWRNLFSQDTPVGDTDSVV